MGRQNAMMKSSKVTNSIARDLTSHASEAPEHRDFNHLKNAGKTLLTARNMNQGPPRDQDETTRSVTSEYDYQHKKKFTDVMGNTITRN